MFKHRDELGEGEKGRKEKGMYVLLCLFFLTGLHDERYF